jgi:hypothetical protein
MSEESMSILPPLDTADDSSDDAESTSNDSIQSPLKSSDSIPLRRTATFHPPPLSRSYSSVKGFSFSFLQSLANSDSTASKLSLSLGVSFEYCVTCLAALLLPIPFFVPSLLRLTEGHYFFQRSVYCMLACVPIMAVVLLMVSYTNTVALPSELVFSAAAYLLVAFANVSSIYSFAALYSSMYSINSLLQATKYAFFEVPPQRASTGTNLYVVHDFVRSTDVQIQSEVESRLEEEWVEEQLKHVFPAEDDMPVRASYDLEYTGGRTTKSVFLQKWLYRSMTVSLVYVVFGLFYRAYWLPSHSPIVLHASGSSPVTMFVTNTSVEAAAVTLSRNRFPPWFTNIIDPLNKRLPFTDECSHTIHNAAPFGFGGYRMGCSSVPNPTFMSLLVTDGTISLYTVGDLLCTFLCLLVMFCLKTELFFFLFESLDIFYLRMKLLRRFTQLTASSLTDSPIDWLSVNGLRRWLQLRQRVLGYYESRYMALQSSSAILFGYTLVLGGWLVMQNSRAGGLILDDLTMHALLDLLLVCAFFAVTSMISQQISALQKEHVPAF